MADAKISALTALAGTDLVATDLLPVIDVSATTAGSKQMTIDEFLTGILGGTSVLDTTYSLASAATFGWSTDVVLMREAADILTMRRTTNAQGVRLYKTYTSGTDFSRLFVGISGSSAYVETQRGTSGDYVSLNLGSSAGASIIVGSNVSISNAGSFSIASAFLVMTEQSDPAAPAANTVNFYAKDNGSGKTQIVARFPTGAVQVIATEP